MDYSERRGSFSIGAYPDLVMHHLPRGIQSFRDRYPDVRIRLLARAYSPLIQLVRSGEVDLGFCSPPPADDFSLEFTELFEYNVVLMTPPGHPLLSQSLPTLQGIAGWPLILSGQESLTRQKVEQALKAHGLSCEVVLALDDTESIKRYVEIGMGVAVCSDFTLHQEDHDKLGVARLDHLFPSFRIGMCTLKGKFLGKAVRNFMDALSEELTGFHQEFTDWNNSGVSPNPVAVADTISD
jgi:DNA-binding transcriptional LysR family regulator